MNWMRITKIRNETGGTISVNYSGQDCKAGQAMPTPHTNTRRCYPVIWEPEGYTNAGHRLVPQVRGDHHL